MSSLCRFLWLFHAILFSGLRSKMNSGARVLAMLAQRPARQSASRSHPADRSISHPLRVLIVAVPPMRTLDVFGPAEVFGDANWLRGGDPAYKVNIISACADRVVANHLGTPVHTDRTYREYSGPIDTLLVAGCMGPRELNGSVAKLPVKISKSGGSSHLRRPLTTWCGCGICCRQFKKYKSGEKCVRMPENRAFGHKSWSASQQNTLSEGQ